MTCQKRKNQTIIIVIFALALVPFALAWYLVGNTKVVIGTNNGRLITPPITTSAQHFIGFDEFSSQNMQQLRGRWVLINVMPSDNCQELCQQAIHKTKQLRLMMGKDLTRIRRLLILPAADNKLLAKWLEDDPRLLKAKLTPAITQKLHKITGGNILDGAVFLMDPLGNLMMQYPTNFDPYNIKKDMKKLLRISQIG